MRTLEELFDFENVEFKVKLNHLTAIEKDTLINGLFCNLKENRSKINALTCKFTGVTPLDFTIISQPDFQITFFGKAEEEPLDQNQYVYIEGYLNHKKVESRRFLVSDIEQFDKEQKEKSVAPIPPDAVLGELVPEVLPETFDLNDAESI